MWEFSDIFLVCELQLLKVCDLDSENSGTGESRSNKTLSVSFKYLGNSLVPNLPLNRAPDAKISFSSSSVSQPYAMACLSADHIQL